MLKYEEKVIKSSRKVLVKRICDICGKETKQPHTSNKEWDHGNYEIAETKVYMREGVNYPEGGSGTEFKIDICPECFRDKLMPWLKSYGSEVKETDWFY